MSSLVTTTTLKALVRNLMIFATRMPKLQLVSHDDKFIKGSAGWLFSSDASKIVGSVLK